MASESQSSKKDSIEYILYDIENDEGVLTSNSLEKIKGMIERIYPRPEEQNRCVVFRVVNNEPDFVKPMWEYSQGFKRLDDIINAEIVSNLAETAVEIFSRKNVDPSAKAKVLTSLSNYFTKKREEIEGDEE